MTDAFASSPVFNTLGLTLLHFLWQGLVIGLVTALALTMMRRQTATARYGVACAGLVAMVAAPLGTWQTLTASAIAVDVVHAPVVAGSLLIGTSAPAPMAPSGAWTAASLDTLMPFVVMVWMTGVLLLTLRLMHVWVAVEGLRRRTQRPLPAAWKARVDALAARVGIARHLRTAESSLLDVPTVVGWLRPVILVPASALAALAPSQLEAILVHELAHVRRHDYLVNLVQRVVETLLFYHPAVWWVSRQITLERELCCDDIAVDVCGDRVAYAHALASLEQLRPAMPTLALTATGGSLVVRIRRLLNGTPPGADRSPIRTAAAVVVTLGVLFAVSGRVTRAEIPPAASATLRTDIQLSALAAPARVLVSTPVRPSVVSAASMARAEQPQPQAPPSPTPGPPSTSAPPPGFPSSTLMEMFVGLQATNAMPPDTPYVIGAGDILGVSVLQDLKLWDDVVVLPDGNVKLPVANNVRADGLTLEQFRAEVASKFDVGPRHVIVLLKQSHRPRNVVIAGQVRRPGEYPLTGRMTLQDLIAQAGGLTDLADHRFVLRRPSNQVGGSGGGLTAVVSAFSVGSGFELRTGDVVYVD